MTNPAPDPQSADSPPPEPPPPYSLVDPTTGKPVDLPKEAVGSAFKEGKARFAPGTRVPMVWQGQVGTVPAEEVATALGNGAELHLDPNGAWKAAAAGFARGATGGGSDWLAIEGQKFLGDSEGAERTRAALEGLQKEHPYATGAGELAGTGATMLIPGRGEAAGAAEALRLGKAAEGAAEFAGAHASQALGVGRDAAEAAEASKLGTVARQAGSEVMSGLTPAAQTALAAAEAQARTGRTVGSAISSFARKVDPNRLIGRAGAGAEEAVGRIFGGKTVPHLARWGAEGAIYGAANELDESELGNTQLTAEGLLASMEHGALYGSALGLVATGASKLATTGGRIAARIALADAGGSAAQVRRAVGALGADALGTRMLEDGIEAPFHTAEQKYARAIEVGMRDGQEIQNIVRRADGGYQGIKVGDVLQSFDRAVEAEAEKLTLAGGNGEATSARLKGEARKRFGWVEPPAPPPAIDVEAVASRRAKGLRAKFGIPDILPPEPTKAQIFAEAQKRAEQAGLLSIKPEPMPTREQLGNLATQPFEQWPKMARDAYEGPAARNAAREQLLSATRQEIRKPWEAMVTAHQQIEAESLAHAARQQSLMDRRFRNMTEAVKQKNASLFASFEQVRELRTHIDNLIPWSRGADAITNAGVEVKKAARAALEGAVERGFDEAAAKSQQPELRALYQHAKIRYAQSKTIAEMLERKQARELNRYGKMHTVSGMLGMGLIGHGAMSAHPLSALGGVATMVYRAHGPSITAWALHKATKMAQIRALQDEVQVAVRRGARAAATGKAPVQTARVAVPDLPPHEMRARAAQAMADVLAATGERSFAGRIAALDPSLPVIAPQTALALDGQARRAITWLASRIPPRISMAVAQGRAPKPTDISDAQAKEFMAQAAVVVDPRVATDAASAGRLTTAQSQAFRGIWSALHREHGATIGRVRQTESAAYDALNAARRAQLESLHGTSAGLEIGRLQQSSGAMNPAVAPSPGQGQGRVNVSSGYKHMTPPSLTASQLSESGPPGRRGTKAAIGGF